MSRPPRLTPDRATMFAGDALGVLGWYFATLSYAANHDNMGELFELLWIVSHFGPFGARDFFKLGDRYSKKFLYTPGFGTDKTVKRSRN